VGGARPTGWKSYDSVADAYDRLTPPLFGPLARDLIALLDPPVAGLVLDAGTGTGVAAEAAASAIGERGAVVGVDPSLRMLGLARHRTQRLAAGVCPGLPFPDRTFHAVVANLVLSHFTDRAAAVADLVRVLRPGGRLGATAWAEDQDDPERDGPDGYEIVTATLDEFDLAVDPPEPAAPGEEWLRDPANLRATFTDAGLEQVAMKERTYQRRPPVLDYLGWQFWGTRGRYLRSITDEATWDRFWRAALGRLERRFPDGVPSVSRLRLAVGTKPAVLSAG
jgi:SAM-dependent methyltransferase